MNIHCPALSSHGIPPDFIQNPVPGQYNPLIFQQEAEQFKFLQRQCHIFSIHADQVPGGRHFQMLCLIFHCSCRCTIPL